MAQLCQHLPEFETLNTQLVVISFCTPKQARIWLDQTNTPFRLLLDPEREVYRTYGLEYSLLRSWSPKVWLEYARLMRSGRKWRGIQGDSGQLGGDFIVDKIGILRLVHPSHDPTDRPPVDNLLRVLRDLSSS